MIENSEAILAKGQAHYNPQDLIHKFVCVEELFCAFSEQLEFNSNDPSYEFLKRRMDFLDEEVEELREGIETKNDKEILDGAIDVLFIAMTQAYQLFRMRGIEPELAVDYVLSAMSEVGISNMLKNIPTEKGKKITKPEGWEAPKFEMLNTSNSEKVENYDDK